jgi:hypothetical protein
MLGKHFQEIANLTGANHLQLASNNVSSISLVVQKECLGWGASKGDFIKKYVIFYLLFSIFFFFFKKNHLHKVIAVKVKRKYTFLAFFI